MDFIAVKMSSHQESKDKPRSSKCHHFCLPFDSHNYCPACREANKGDDPCVTLEKPCEICWGFSEEQILKIKNRKQKVTHPKMTIWIFWEMRTCSPFLAHMQTLKVLLTIYLHHLHVPITCILRLYY